MTRISAVSFVDLPAQPVLSVSGRVEFPAKYDQWYARVFQALNERLGQLNVRPAGPSFVSFCDNFMPARQIEAGFPTATLLKGNDVVTGRIMEATAAAVVMDQGPFQESEPTRLDAIARIGERGLEQTGPIINYFLNDPSYPPEKRLTQITIPVDIRL